jgi:integrase
MANGKKSPYYHYRTMVDGRLFTGSTKCSGAAEAREFEENFVKDLRRETSEKAVLIKIHDKVSGGRRIELTDAWGRFLRKPRDRGMTEARRKAAESRWNDFLAFLRDRHPTLKALNEVGPRIAEAYIEHIRTQGRWQRSVTFKRRGDRKDVSYKQNLQNLSTAARNDFLQTCKAVFRHLKTDAGCVDSPFEHIKALKNQASTREPFSPEELKKIGEKAEGDMYSLFLTGISTGLREGDICTLRWDEVDLDRRQIARRMRKTGKVVNLPILPGLYEHLRALPKPGDYVFPGLANLYTENPSGISYRVRRLFHDIKITTRKKVTGRDRKVSIKDVHSLRHTFVYLAGLHRVPLPVVQGVVGHFSSDMTQLYMNHATDEAKRTELARIPNYLAPAAALTGADALVASIKSQLEGQPAETIQATIAALQAMLPKPAPAAAAPVPAPALAPPQP